MLILLVIICLFATVIGSICGVGGGVIIRPVMDAVSGLPVSEISFLSGCTVLAMAAFSVAATKREPRGEGRWSTLLLALGAAAGGVLGKAGFTAVRALIGNDAALTVVQNLLLLALTAGTFLYMRSRARITTRQMRNPPVICLVGLALGLVSAFLGIGGGPFNIVVLSYFFSEDSKTAAKNSLLIVLLSQAASLLATLVKRQIPPLHVEYLVAMAVSGVLGGVLGRMIAKRIDARTTDRLFYVLLGIIALICVFNIVRNLAA